MPFPFLVFFFFFCFLEIHVLVFGGHRIFSLAYQNRDFLPLSHAYLPTLRVRTPPEAGSSLLMRLE